jgi:hypothetical protein
MTPFLWIDELSPDLKLLFRMSISAPLNTPLCRNLQGVPYRYIASSEFPNLRLKNCECGNSERLFDLFLFEASDFHTFDAFKEASPSWIVHRPSLLPNFPIHG